MINLKSLTASLLILGFSFNVLAGSMGSAMDVHLPKENLYAGLGVGGIFSKEQVITQNVILGNTASASMRQNLWEGAAYLGYGHTFQNSWFLGVEANTTFPHRTLNIYSPGVTIIGPLYQEQISINDYLGIDFQPGYRINSDVLVYARAGIGFRDIALNQPQNTSDSPSFLNTENAIGGRFGAGLTYSLTKNIATSIDYYYSYFPKFISNWPLFDLQYRIQSHANHVGLSILYTV